MTSVDGKKKILMLHGFVQSGSIFRSKTGGLRKKMNKLGFELYYPTAPLLVTKKVLERLYGTTRKTEEGTSETSLNLGKEFNSTDDTDKIYGWYIKTDPDSACFDLDLSTLSYLHDYIVENGPFDGLIGFSQGAGVGGYLLTNFQKLLSLTRQEQPDLRFFISFSGFMLDDIKFRGAYSKNPITVPSLHVQGELDSVVSETKSMSLYNACQEDCRTLLKHPGGHFVPNSTPFITQVCNWIQAITNEQVPTMTWSSQKELQPNQQRPVLDADLLDMIDAMGKI